MKDLRDKKIGLVLSGGGGKGAYQIGMLRALEKMGMQKEHLVLSGTSIGAMNALFYAVRDTDAIRDLMRYFSQGAPEGKRTPVKVLEQAKEEVATGTVSLQEFVSEPRFRLTGGKDLYDYFCRELPDRALKESQIPVSVSAYSLIKERAQYYTLNGKTPEDQRKLILASGSLPFLFEPVSYHGDYLLDGGVVPSICKNPGPADKIPVRRMEQEELDLLIISYLKPEDQVDLSGITKAKEIVELRPGEPLELTPGGGTLDFSKEAMEHHETLGYRETLQWFDRWVG